MRRLRIELKVAFGICLVCKKLFANAVKAAEISLDVVHVLF